MNSPIRWFGGKGNMVANILPLLPPHREYVEPFGGGASILFAKRPAKVETYNDIDEELHNFFTVLADPELFERFHRRVALLPYSRKLYNGCRHSWQDCEDRVERAANGGGVAEPQSRAGEGRAVVVPAIMREA